MKFKLNMEAINKLKEREKLDQQQYNLLASYSEKLPYSKGYWTHLLGPQWALGRLGIKLNFEEHFTHVPNENVVAPVLLEPPEEAGSMQVEEIILDSINTPNTYFSTVAPNRVLSNLSSEVNQELLAPVISSHIYPTSFSDNPPAEMLVVDPVESINENSADKSEIPEDANNEEKSNKYPGKDNKINKDKIKFKLNMEVIGNAIACGKLHLSREQQKNLFDLKDQEYTYGTWRHNKKKLGVKLPFKLYFKEVSTPKTKKTNAEKDKMQCKLNMKVIKELYDKGKFNQIQYDLLVSYSQKIYSRGYWRRLNSKNDSPLFKNNINLNFKEHLSYLENQNKAELNSAEKIVASTQVESSQESSVFNSITVPDHIDQTHFEMPHLGPHSQTSNVTDVTPLNLSYGAVSNVSSTLFFHRKAELSLELSTDLSPSSPNPWQKYLEGDDDLEIDQQNFQL